MPQHVVPRTRTAKHLFLKAFCVEVHALQCDFVTIRPVQFVVGLTEERLSMCDETKKPFLA
jgi:hypothetical protein